MRLEFTLANWKLKIHLSKFHDSLIISSANRKIVLGNEVADRIQV